MKGYFNFRPVNSLINENRDFRLVKRKIMSQYLSYILKSINRNYFRLRIY